jgi:two-component system, chemotaxis family, sensor kinase CheA
MSDKIQKTILVAEDDKFYANVYKRKLEMEGFKVVLAENGEIALKLARGQTPDLILLDLIMPVMDGFTALSELKKDDKLKNVRVIVLSNLGQDEDVAKAKGLGASDYIVKSNLSINDLVNKIKA